MTGTRASARTSTIELTEPIEPTGPSGRPRGRRLIIGTVAGLAIAAAAGVLLVDPFGGPTPSGDSGGPTVTRPVVRRTLAATTPLNGTLAYGTGRRVLAPSGVTAQQLAQDQQAVNAARANVEADRSATRDSSWSGGQQVSGARTALADARRTLAADRATTHRDCSRHLPSCREDRQTVRQDEQAVHQASSDLGTARAQAATGNDQADAQLNADELALSGAEDTLSSDRASAVNAGQTYSWLPGQGHVIGRGQTVYGVSGVRVPLFYGHVTPWRALYLGVSDGRDVAELNANLAALGFGTGLGDSRHFSPATEGAVKRWQAHTGATQTGAVALGDFVAEAGPMVVTEVSAKPGTAVHPGGPVLTLASTRPEVIVALAVDLQSQVRRGDTVLITLPDQRTTPGRVVSIGAIATTPSSQSGESSTPTVSVKVRLTHPHAAQHLDQAPVQVAITTSTVHNALAVPVEALVAVRGTGYAVETVDPDGHHHLVRVRPGLFDDSAGLVQVTGSGLSAGQRVVVPAP